MVQSLNGVQWLSSTCLLIEEAGLNTFIFFKSVHYYGSYDHVYGPQRIGYESGMETERDLLIDFLVTVHSQ